MNIARTAATGLATLAMCVLIAAAAENQVPGADAWDGRTAQLGVVHPVVRSPLQKVISLRGDWEFATDPQACGRAAGWMRPGAVWPDLRTILVPGCWEAQGVGEPGISQPWDMNDRGPYPLRHIYMGAAWYRRTVSVPAAWQGKRVWLKIGGVRSQGWFWVNGKPVAHDYNYCAADRYDVTDLVTPGQAAAVVAQVRNDLPSRKGCAGWRHRAGGLIRDVELEATPDTRIDNCWVRGDFDKKAADIRVTVAFATEAGKLKNPVLRVKVAQYPELGRRKEELGVVGEASVAVAFADGKTQTEIVCRVPLEPFRAWSPEHPHLYVAEVTLCDGDTPVHGWSERFGVRKLEVRGDRFFLNDKPFFVRGYGHNSRYPLTLVSPASKEEHLGHLMIARAAGFNYTRLHTHCEMPEFYEAADEAGMLVQAELPYNHAKPGEAFPSDPKRDLTELITHYQRYVSLATCCMGNEGGFPSPLDNELYDAAKRLNPQLLVLHHDGGNNTRKNSDFRSGPSTFWRPGSFVSDVPFVAHEYLNLSVKADPRLEPLFTGAYYASLASLDPEHPDAAVAKARAGFPRHMSDLDSAPRDVRSYEAELKRLQLSRAWGDACVDAGHALQRCYQKLGIESARLDPACDGYSFWLIADVLYQAPGLFNVFWGTKSCGATPEEFRLLNGPTALLLKTDPEQRIVVAGDKVKAGFWITHYGDEPLKQARLAWTLRAGNGILAQGECAGGDVELGATRLLAEQTLLIPSVDKPVHAVLDVKLVGTVPRREPGITNSWDFWLFPERMPQDVSGVAATRQLYPFLTARFPGLARARTPEGDAAKVLIASEHDPEVTAALESGRRVVLLDRCKSPDNVQLGWWLLGNQTGTAMARHPAFGDFPHNGFLSPLWFRIVKRPELLQADNGFCGAEPLMVGDGLYGYSLYLCQAQVGKGRLLRACGLDVLTDTPEGVYLLDALLGYARSEAFTPKASLDFDLLAAWLKKSQRVFTELNGWGRTLKADAARSVRPFFGSARSSVLSLPSGKTGLEWETLPPPADGSGSNVTFRWLHVTRVGDWDTKVARQIAVSLNGKGLLTYTAGILAKEWAACEGESRLEYRGMDFTQNESMGVMALTVPRSWVKPGAPCVIRLAAEPDGKGDLSTGVIEVNTATFNRPRTSNGWQKTILAGDSGRNKLPPGVSQIDVARAMKGKNELVWETFPASGNVREKPEYTVEWQGGMGYFAEPQGSFTLYVNDEKVLNIPSISQTDAEWKCGDGSVRLKYARDVTTAEYGTLTLTLPSSKVAPGKPLRLKVVGSESDSLRWFGVFQTW